MELEVELPSVIVLLHQLRLFTMQPTQRYGKFGALAFKLDHLHSTVLFLSGVFNLEAQLRSFLLLMLNTTQSDHTYKLILATLTLC
jgi:hypothetical protein